MVLQLRRRKKPYDPFKTWKMKTKIHCNKCGFEKVSDFQRFDYVCMKVSDKRAKHKKCDGDVEITGIWYEYNETPEEKKWKEYERRFH